jgi:ethanolamine transporter EutH
LPFIKKPKVIFKNDRIFWQQNFTDMNMKKLLIILVLIGGVTAIAFASLSSRKNNKQAIEKKAEKKEKKCSRTCIFS